MFAPASIPFAALTPCASAATLWQRRGQLGLTYVVKATFAFEPDRAAQLTEPLAVVPRDRHHDKTPAQSVEAASELAPFLPSAGVVLTGHAHAPAGQGAVPSSSARLMLVRDQVLLDKTVHVYGDRNPTRPRECVPFQLIPLRWELAVGGPKHPDHPVGAGTDCVPNIIHAVDPTKPGGFGPIGWDWPVRRRLLGRFDRRQLMARVPEFPDGFDWRYFNPAPADQQLDSYLQGDEWIVLQGMSPLAPQLRTRLPSARAEARAVMITPKGPTPPEPIPLVADLLIIDADRELCSVVWRGNRVLAHEESELPLVGVLAGVATAGSSIPWPAEGDLGPLHDALMAADAAQPAAIVDRELGPSGPRGGVSGPIFIDSPGIEPPMASGTERVGTAGTQAPVEPPPVPMTATAPAAPELPAGAVVGGASALAAGAGKASRPQSAGSEDSASAPAPASSDDPAGPAPSDPPPSSPPPEPPTRRGDDIPIVDGAPYDVGTQSWQIKPPQDALILFVKGTYDIVPGGAAKPRAEPEFCTGELFHDDDPEKSCVYPDDTAIFKPKTDVVMIGHAHAPHGQATAMKVALRFGHEGNQFAKTIYVQGDRKWQRSLGRAKPTEPEPFEKIPLVYERAYGGVDYHKNPVGAGHGKSEPLPNLEQPGKLVTSPSDKVEPACFAPIGMEWKDRWRKMGTYGRKWLETRWPYYPDDFDWSFYQAAPSDQQLDLPLRGDEPFAAEGVHPEHREIGGTLPGERPRCFAIKRESEGGGFEELDLRLDTAVFDFDEMKLNLLWRGHVDVRADDAPEIDHLFVTRQRLDEPDLTLEEARRRYVAEITLQPAAETGAEEPANDEGDLPEHDPERARLEEELAKTEEAIQRAIAEAGLPEEDPANPPPPPNLASIASGLEAAGATQAEIDEVLEALEPPQHAAAADGAPPPAPGIREQVTTILQNDDSLVGFDFEAADLSELDFSGQRLDSAVMSGACFARCNFDGASLQEVLADESDFREASLVGANLSSADLNDAKLDNARLEHAVLCHAELAGASGEGAVLTGATVDEAFLMDGNWSRADFRNTSATQADFTGCVLDGADFGAATLTSGSFCEARGERVIFDGAELTGAFFADARLPGCSLRMANAPEAVFENALLDEASLHGSNLRDSSWLRAVCRNGDFSQADLREARMERANLAGAKFVRANLMSATLESADLTIADLRGANLHGAGLWKAELQDAKLDGAILTQSSLVARSS